MQHATFERHIQLFKQLTKDKDLLVKMICFLDLAPLYVLKIDKNHKRKKTTNLLLQRIIAFPMVHNNVQKVVERRSLRFL